MPITATLTDNRRAGAHSGLIPFKPGQSGNPGGRTKLEAEMRRLAQAMSMEAMERAGEIMKQKQDDRAALVAIGIILDRAYGKPKEMTAETQQALLDVAKLGPDNLTLLATLLRQAMADPVKDASSEVDVQADSADTSIP